MFGSFSSFCSANFSCQQESNSDHHCRRQGRWPLEPPPRPKVFGSLLSFLTFPGLSVSPSGAQDQLHRPRLVWQPGVRLHLRVAGKRPQVLRDQDGEGGFAGREQEQLGRPSYRTTVSVCRPSCEGRTPFWRLLQKFKSPSQATVGFSGSITIKGDLWWKSYTLRNALKLDNLILNDRDSGFYWVHDMATMRHFFPWILGFFRL